MLYVFKQPAKGSWVATVWDVDAEVLRANRTTRQISKKSDPFQMSNFQAGKAEDTWSGRQREEARQISDIRVKVKKNEETWFN